MTTYIGFNTINQYKKFTLTDFDLIKRDLLNAFGIRQGQLPGRPGYGTIIYDYVFESQDTTTERAILAEVQRVAVDLDGAGRLFLMRAEAHGLASVGFGASMRFRCTFSSPGKVVIASQGLSKSKLRKSCVSFTGS
jgi:hypothetical protein